MMCHGSGSDQRRKTYSNTLTPSFCIVNIECTAKCISSGSASRQTVHDESTCGIPSHPAASLPRGTRSGVREEPVDGLPNSCPIVCVSASELLARPYHELHRCSQAGGSFVLPSQWIHSGLCHPDTLLPICRSPQQMVHSSSSCHRTALWGFSCRSIRSARGTGRRGVLSNWKLYVGHT